MQRGVDLDVIVDQGACDRHVFGTRNTRFSEKLPKSPRQTGDGVLWPARQTLRVGQITDKTRPFESLSNASMREVYALDAYGFSKRLNGTFKSFQQLKNVSPRYER